MTVVTELTDVTPCSPEEVLTLLREEMSLYRQLEADALRQRSLITGDDLGALLTLLADRQRLSVELRRIGGRLAPIRRDWQVYREGLTASQRVEADRLIADIADRLRRVIKSDEEDGRLLSARKQATAQQLRATHSTRGALSAYRPAPVRWTRVDHLNEAS